MSFLTTGSAPQDQEQAGSVTQRTSTGTQRKIEDSMTPPSGPEPGEQTPANGAGARPDALTGTLVKGRFRLENKLGSGGMSTVYRAFDQTLERWVAIKLMHREFSSEPEQLERFRREARSAAGLSHPHVVTVIDAGEDDGHPYIVLEYIDGETLKERIRRQGPLPTGEAVAYAIEIGRALEVAHGARLVHRDIKPQNVLIDAAGRAKVTDFGIVRSLEQDGMTLAGRVLGTTDYVSPEQALGEAVSEQSDIYSLGVCLYEMLTGAAPFGGDTHVAVAMKHVREPMPDVREARPDVSAALAAVVDHATAKERRYRYSTVREMVDDLEAVLGIEAARAGETTGEATAVLRALPARRAGVAPGRLRRPGRGPALTALALIALVVVGIVLSSRVESDRGAGADAPGEEPLRVVGLEGEAIDDYDPESDDGVESSEAVANVIDEIPTTVWDTETYECSGYGCDFSDPAAPKSGVGLTIDAGAPIAARRLDLEVSIPDWGAEIYGANTIPDSIEGWEGPLGGTDDTDQETQVDIDTGGVEYRYYLLWITRLPAEEQEAGISELTLRS
jgi:serine/threonine-protein kinase